MFRFEEHRIIARRKLLNSKDIINFDKVPNFIINSFFGECCYKSRLTVVTFSFLNGISPSQCLEMCRFKFISKTDIQKMYDLYKYFKLERYSRRYYSYSVYFGKVLFLNGDLRLNKTRLINHNIQNIL